MTEPGRPERLAHERWLRVGAAMVVVGTVASVMTLLPLVSGSAALPVAAYLLCFLAPLGLAVVLVALWRRARTRTQRMSAPHITAE